MPKLSDSMRKEFWPAEEVKRTVESVIGTYREFNNGAWYLLNQYNRGTTFHPSRGQENWDGGSVLV